MKILEVDFYLDGGSAKIVTDNGIYFVNRRVDAKDNWCELYDRYPGDREAKKISLDKDLLISALKEFTVNTEMSNSLNLLLEHLIGNDVA
jgi:hypothetical protein